MTTERARSILSDYWNGFPSVDTTAARLLASVVGELLDRLEPHSMETAPTDGTPFLAYSVDLKGCGLSPFFSVCAWHEDAGFCTDEIREPIYWWPLPEISEKGRSNGPNND
jgi:hypothetical protein